MKKKDSSRARQPTHYSFLRFFDRREILSLIFPRVQEDKELDSQAFFKAHFRVLFGSIVLLL